MKHFAIFGAGGFGREVMPLVQRQCASMNEPYQLVFVDDNPESRSVNGVPVLSYEEWLALPAESRHINIAIANSAIREQLVKRSQADGVQFFDVCADNVIKLSHVQIDEGSLLCPFVTLTSNVIIGKHFHANIYSYIAHDCQIGDYVTFAPGVKCNGNVVIEDHAYIGTGAILKHGTNDKPLRIGKGAIVGMGAVVTEDVAPGITVVGNPAKPMVRVYTVR